MGNAKELFLQKTRVSLNELSLLSGISVEVFRVRHGHMSARGKVFWYLLTGDATLAPTPEEKSVLLSLEEHLLQRPDLVRLLQEHLPASPLLKEVRELPQKAQIDDAMQAAGQWDVGYLLCKESYNHVLEGGRFSDQDLQDTKKLAEELNKRLFLATHQSGAERNRILNQLGATLNILMLNIDTLGAENTLLAAQAISNDFVTELITNKKEG